MSFETRPSTNEVFAERLRSAEARRLQEESRATRSPRVTNKAKADARKAIEVAREQKELEDSLMEVWG